MSQHLKKYSRLSNNHTYIVTTELNGICIIRIDYIGQSDLLLNQCCSIIKNFMAGDTLFYGFFRTDGIYLSQQQEIYLKSQIPEYINSIGKYEWLLFDMLSIARTKVNNELYDFLPQIFRYYLSTMCFCPKIEWETFKTIFSQLMTQDIDQIMLLNNYADYLFCYDDSDTFSLKFDSKKIDKSMVIAAIEKILYT